MGKRVLTPEQRERNASYLRAYRARNPERVRAWRNNYILRKAARLLAEAEQAEGDGNGGVD